MCTTPTPNRPYKMGFNCPSSACASINTRIKYNLSILNRCHHNARPMSQQRASDLDTSDGCRVVSTIKSREQKHFQSIAWTESLLAVRVSTECSSVKELRHRLWLELPQNSPHTRRRRTSVILGRFFPNKNIEQLPRRVCMTYQDDALLASVMG